MSSVKIVVEITFLFALHETLKFRSVTAFQSYLPQFDNVNKIHFPLLFGALRHQVDGGSESRPVRNIQKLSIFYIDWSYRFVYVQFF